MGYEAIFTDIKVHIFGFLILEGLIRYVYVEVLRLVWTSLYHCGKERGRSNLYCWPHDALLLWI